MKTSSIIALSILYAIMFLLVVWLFNSVDIFLSIGVMVLVLFSTLKGFEKRSLKRKGKEEKQE